jgi:50S ribosomal protein L16 3-hydroxylase
VVREPQPQRGYNRAMRQRWLGGLSTREFLRRHWQKRPLLARAAWTAPAGLPQRTELLALACRSDVEARLVTQRAGRWRLEHGPFQRRRFASLPARNWTLLVNGVNLQVPAAERLLRRFDFLPQARLDDVMVSYAAPGGGVGPHDDSYDVFLLQGPGRRVWRLQRPRPFTLLADAPLRLIADFAPDEEYLLEPGDLLYLPPGWAHDGIALEPCFTYSVGCRAPRGAELALAMLDYLHERGLPDAEYRDPALRPPARSAQIGGAMLGFARRVLRRVRWTARDVQRVLGRHLTTPKPHVVFRPPRRPLARAAFLRQLARGAVVLDARSALLYRGSAFFLNGEAVALRAAQRRPLARFADRRRGAGAALARAGLGAQLYAWYGQGYLHLERSA